MTDPTFAKRSARAEAKLRGDDYFIITWTNHPGEWKLAHRQGLDVEPLDIDTDKGLLDATSLFESVAFSRLKDGTYHAVLTLSSGPNDWRGCWGGGDTPRAAIKAAWVEYVDRSEGDAE